MNTSAAKRSPSKVSLAVVAIVLPSSSPIATPSRWPTRAITSSPGLCVNTSHNAATAWIASLTTAMNAPRVSFASRMPLTSLSIVSEKSNALPMFASFALCISSAMLANADPEVTHKVGGRRERALHVLTKWPAASSAFWRVLLLLVQLRLGEIRLAGFPDPQHVQEMRPFSGSDRPKFRSVFWPRASWSRSNRRYTSVPAPGGRCTSHARHSLRACESPQRRRVDASRWQSLWLRRLLIGLSVSLSRLSDSP